MARGSRRRPEARLIERVRETLRDTESLSETQSESRSVGTLVQSGGIRKSVSHTFLVLLLPVTLLKLVQRSFCACKDYGFKL